MWNGGGGGLLPLGGKSCIRHRQASLDDFTKFFFSHHKFFGCAFVGPLNMMVKLGAMHCVYPSSPAHTQISAFISPFIVSWCPTSFIHIKNAVSMLARRGTKNFILFVFASGLIIGLLAPLEKLWIGTWRSRNYPLHPTLVTNWAFWLNHMFPKIHSIPQNPSPLMMQMKSVRPVSFHRSLSSSWGHLTTFRVNYSVVWVVF